MIDTDKIVDFKCVPERALFNSEEFKIYGCSVNSFEYPEIHIGKYGTASIKGNFQELNLGIEYTVKAKEISDKYGIGYEVINIKREKPTTQASTRAFLREILTENQTNVLLSVYPDIVDRVMNNRLDDIDLSKTKGIKDYTFQVIKRKIIENFKLAELVEEFRGLFSLSIIKKLYDKYPSVEKIKEKLRTEPYECLCKLSGIGFKTADSMLLSLEQESKESIAKGQKPILHFGFDLKTSYQRAKACIDYLLDENENSGNTYVKIMDIKKEFEILVPEAIANLPLILKGDNDVVFDRELLTICKKETYETEKYIAEKIKEGLKHNTKWDCDCSKFQSLDGFDLTEDQCKVAKYMCEHNIVMLVGYGGSGKSSSTQAFVNMLKHYNKSYLMLAPTGRAAKVLSAYTGEPASTIHRGLGYMPPNVWNFNADNPLEKDVVIVDEFSMVDIFLMRHLLEAIDFTRTKLLLIGDDAQIPSVGAGNVLYDFLNTKMIPTVFLDKIFRYGTGGLSTVATDTRMSKEYLDKTNKGMQVFGDDQSYVFMPIDQDKIVNYTVKVYQTLLQKGNSIEDIGVLTCYNVGDYGTVALNKKLQAVINPNPKAKLIFGDQEFRLNDIVMCVMNDYKAVVYQDSGIIDEDFTTFIANGESGRIVEVLYDAVVIDYDGTKIYCHKSNLNKIKLAYAISTHKCLTADTYIFTDNGLLQIGDLNNKAKVGELKPFNKDIDVYNGFVLEHPSGFYNAGMQECKKIRTKRGYEITGTLDHKTDVLCEDGCIRQKQFDELKIGDHLLINKKNNVYPDEAVMPNFNLDFLIFDFDVRGTIYKHPEKMDEDFALFLGMMVADGCVRTDKDGITYGKNQKEVVDIFNRLVYKLFGYNVSSKQVLPNGVMGGMHLTEVGSKFINCILRQIDGLQPYDKFVPDCILKSNKSVQCAFLKGLFEDGTVNLKKGRFDHIEIAIHNYKMVKQVQMMLLNLGIISTMYFRHNNYYLYIYKRDAKIFYENIGFMSYTKQENLKKCLIDCAYSTNYLIPFVIDRVIPYVKNKKLYSIREKEILRNGKKCSIKALKDIISKTEDVSGEIKNMVEYIDKYVYLDPVVTIEDDMQECFCIEMPKTHKFIQNGFVGSNCQGGSFKNVIFLSPRAHTFMLNSNLLYVGISRAKQSCYHLGEIKTVNNALKKKENFDRKTLLRKFM